MLQTLGQNISEAQAENLWQNGQSRFDNQFRATFSNQGVAIDPGFTDDMIGVTSSYFLARSDIDLDGVPFTFFSVIQRSGLLVVARSRGSDGAPALGEAPAAPVAKQR